MDAQKIAAKIATPNGSPKIKIGGIEAVVRGEWNGEPFEAKLEWNPGTGDPADFELLSGPEDVDPTELLLLIDARPSN